MQKHYSSISHLNTLGTQASEHRSAALVRSSGPVDTMVQHVKLQAKVSRIGSEAQEHRTFLCEAGGRVAIIQNGREAGV